MNVPLHQIASSPVKISCNRTATRETETNTETCQVNKDTQFHNGAISSESISSEVVRKKLCETAIGSLQDGFIIADQQGNIQSINASAQCICELFEPEQDKLPLEILRVCQSAFECQEIPALTRISIDTEINLPGRGAARIRIQNIISYQKPYLLIIIEDYQRTTENRILTDTVLLGLTDREMDVWKLRLKGGDYNEISAELAISANTVKKHIKNILAKHRTYREGLEERADLTSNSVRPVSLLLRADHTITN